MKGLCIHPLRTRAARLFSVDVEDWFHSNFSSIEELDSRQLPRRVEAGVVRLLDVLDRHRARATFFILGVVAEAHPTLARRIANSGHEVGCHGWTHSLLYRQPRLELTESLRHARRLLQDQTGQAVRGFRAPSWSITEKSLWALDVIAEAGFDYDSSIFPARNYLYGIDGAPTRPYEIRTEAGNRLTEIPPSTIGIGRHRTGVGGGFYLRVLPLWVQKAALSRALAKGEPFMVYTHPREFDPDSWALRLPLSLKEDWIFRTALRRGHDSLLELLRDGPWQPLVETVDSARNH